MNTMDEMLKELGFSSDFIKSFNEFEPNVVDYSIGGQESPIQMGVIDGTNFNFNDFQNPDVTNVIISNS